MYERITGLNKLRRSAWSVVSVMSLCLIATSPLLACDGPRPLATPVSTSEQTTTSTQAPTQTSTPTETVGLTVPTLSGELRSTEERATPSPKYAELAHLASGNSVFAFEMYKSLAQKTGTCSSRPTASLWL